ncbi:type II toxin-antitoxin system RelE/ParE family toxin [Desulfosarcina sp. OttesenSCG-928-G10]|nr:type II toxin-antitoxin system RelE/ParE family toxin [Desulfosarcina sp. OttesenSCG-928-G10]
MHKLDLTRSAGKFLQDLPAKQFRQIVTTIFHLPEQPELHDSKQLSSYPEYRRVDIGEYRIIYRHDGDTVKNCVIGKRNDSEVYKQFKRKHE